MRIGVVCMTYSEAEDVFDMLSELVINVEEYVKNPNTIHIRTTTGSFYKWTKINESSKGNRFDMLIIKQPIPQEILNTIIYPLYIGDDFERDVVYI